MWKVHPIYRQYVVSDCGQVRHVRKTANRAGRADRSGYVRINLVHEERRLTRHLHTMVAETFIRLPAAGETVNHRDGDKTNNRVENLEWLSAAANVSHSFKAGLREGKKCHSVVVGGRAYYSKREAERQTGVPRWSL